MIIKGKFKLTRHNIFVHIRRVHTTDFISGYDIGNNERAAPTPKQIPIPILSKQIPNTTPKLMPIGK